MAVTTTYIDGRLEDHQGRVLRPETTAGRVLMEDGKNVEAKVAELLSMLAGYLHKNGGGDITGNVNINNGRMSISNWGAFSSGTDGHVMYAQNAYKNPIDNKYYYLQTHESMGAKGFVMRHGAPGLYWFDTGMKATVQDQEFTPTFKRLDKPDADLVTGQNLNSITANGVYCGSSLQNAPYGSADWWYIFVQNLTDNASNYCLQQAFAINQQAYYFRTLRAGAWQPWERVITEAGGNINGTLTISENGGNVLQLVGYDHVYIPIYKNGISAGRSGYFGYSDSGATALTVSNELPGGAINLSAPGGVQINGQKIPVSYAATWAPGSSDGQDGDVWDVYV